MSPGAERGAAPLDYTLAPLPQGLFFNAATRTLLGRPTTTETAELTYTVTDVNGNVATRC
ncbi:putative Ig domain-containing protein [Candidatus Spongiihabitans sp.]|uniref:putative Ig domain-containing protein n=1 Tax=Candidatus Spongiihabitans sp. TaxID=3101308 RepID=UPI003C6F92A8